MEPEASWPPPPPALPPGNEAAADDVQHQQSRDMTYTPQFHDEEEDLLGANTISVITAGSHASPLGSESSVSSTSSYRRRRASAAVAAAVDALRVHETQNERSRGSSGAIQQPHHHDPDSPEQQPREPTHQHNSARSSPRGSHSRQRSISSLSEPPIQWGGSVTPVLDYHACTAQEDTCEARSRAASRISFAEHYPEQGHPDTPLSFQAPLHLEPQLRASLREGGGGGENPSPRASLSSSRRGSEGVSGVTGLTPFPDGAGREAGHEHQRARSSFASQGSRQSGHLVDDGVGRPSRASSLGQECGGAGEAPCEHYDLEMEEGLARRGSASQCTSRRGSLGSVAGSLAEGEGTNQRLSRPRSASARSSGGGAHEDAASHYSQGQYSRRTSSRASEGPRYLPQEGEAGYGLEVAPSPRSLGASRHSSHSMRDSAKAPQEGRWDAPPTAAGDVAPSQRSSRAPSYSHAPGEADPPQHVDHQAHPSRHRQQAASRGSFSSALGPSMHSRALSLEAQGAGGRARMDRSSHAIEMDHAPHPSERPSTLASKLWPSVSDYNAGAGPSHHGMETAAPAMEPSQEEPQTPWPPHSRTVSRASSISARLPLGPNLEEALTPYPPPSQQTSRASSRSLRRSPTPEHLTRPMAVGRGRDQTGLREDRSAFSNATPPQPPRRASSSLSSSSDGSRYLPPSHDKQQHRGPPVAHGQGVRGSAGRSSFSSLLLHPNAHTAHGHVAHAQAASAIQLDIPVAQAKADIWQDDEIRAEAWETRRRSRETLTQEGGERGHHVHLSNSTAPQHARAVGRRRAKAEEGEGEGEGEKVLGLVREMYEDMDVLRQDMRHMGESSEAGLQALQSQGDERYAQLQGQLSECVAHLRDLRAHAPPQEHHHQHVHHAPLSPAAHAPPSPTHSHMHTYAHHPVHPPQPQSYQPPRHEDQAEVGPGNDHMRHQAPPAYSPQYHQPASAFAFGSLPTAPAPAPIARNNSIPTVVDGAAGFGAAPRMVEGFHFAGGSDEATSPFGRGPGGATGSWGTDGSFLPTGTGGQSFAGFAFGAPAPAPRPPRPAAQSGFFVPPSETPQSQQHHHPLLQLSPDRQTLLVQFLDQLAQRRQRQQDKLLEAELLSLDVEDLSRRRSYSEARVLDGWGSRGLGQERWAESGRREGGGMEGLWEEVGRVRGKCEGNGEALAAARLELLQLEERMAAGERENRQRFESVRRALKLFSDTLRVDLPPHFLSTYSSYSPTTRSRYSSQRWHTSP